MLAFALLFTAIALRMRLAFVVLLARRLRLRLRRARFRRTRLGLRLRRAHLNVRLRLRCRTRCFHVRFRPVLLRLAGHAHLRRLVVRALLRGRCRVAVEAIRLLATALWLKLRLRLRRLGQLGARLKGVAFVTRRTGCALTLRWACRQAGRALRCLRGLRLGRALLRCSGAWLRTWAIDRARCHQRLRSRPRLAAALWLRTLRVRGADQTLWPVRTVLLRRSAKLAAGACRSALHILRGATQTEPCCLRSYGSGRHSGTGLASHGRDAGAHVAARPGRASARQRAAL